MLNLNMPCGYFFVNRIAKKAMNVTTIQAIHRKNSTMKCGITSNHFTSTSHRFSSCGYSISSVTGYLPSSSVNGGYSSRIRFTYALTFADHRRYPAMKLNMPSGYFFVNRMTKNAMIHTTYAAIPTAYNTNRCGIARSHFTK